MVDPVVNGLETLRSTASESDYLLDVDHKSRLFLVYTLKCNWACSHCLVSSSPSRKEKMELEVACDLVTAAVEAGTEVVYLTGGEVMLYPNDMVALVRHITACGASSVLETNGSWAVRHDKTIAKLRELQDEGLACLALSIDHYHLEYGTLSRSLDLIEVAREIDLPCRVLVVASPHTDTDVEITRSLDERSIPYFYEAVMTLGRGQELGSHSAILQRQRCDSVGVTVLPDGDVLSCVGAYDGFKTLRHLPLYAGNAKGPGALEVFREERRNPIARAIDERGHEFLLEQLTPTLRQEVAPRASCESLCGYCHKMLGNSAVVEHLQTVLGDFANESA
jgi:organic radical activating enzyme